MQNLIRILILILIGCFTFSRTQAQEIHEAVKNGNTEKVKSLLAGDLGLIKLKDARGNTPLHIAVKTGNKDVVELLISKGADIQAAGERHFSPLHTALIARQKEIVRFLIDNGADVNALDGFGRPPLIYIPWFTDDVETAERLIKKGADINFVSVEGASALSQAIFSNRKGLIELFLRNGVDLPTDENKIRQYLASCASSGCVNLFHKLLEKGGSIRMENRFGGTLLHSAASGGSVEMARMLVEKGLPIDKKDRYGLTALHLAASRGKKSVVEFLLLKNADQDLRSTIGKTALNYAEESGEIEIADFLKANDADQSAQQFPILRGDYVGQKEPGMTPEPFAPGIISQNRNEHSILVFSPDGSEIYWSPEYGKPILFMKRMNDKWFKPKPVSFTFKNLDAEPVISHDGRKLFFLSRRPVDDNDESEKERIWVVDRKGDDWSEPKPIKSEITSHWQISIAKNGTLYFGSPGAAVHGGSDIYRSRLVNGKYTESENLGDAVNSDGHDMQPYIAPDESYIIISRLGAKDSFGGKDLYISFKMSDGSWTQAKNMGQNVNSIDDECNPYISPDGKYFFFSRGSGCDYYWVSSKVIDGIYENRS